MKRIVIAMVVSYLAVALVGLLLGLVSPPWVTPTGMVAYMATLAAPVAAVTAANVWAAVWVVGST